MNTENQLLRVAEFANATGYKVSTIRKKIYRREISFYKVGRNVCIPRSEVLRLLNEFRPRIDRVRYPP